MTRARADAVARSDMGGGGGRGQTAIWRRPGWGRGWTGRVLPSPLLGAIYVWIKCGAPLRTCTCRLLHRGATFRAFRNCFPGVGLPEQRVIQPSTLCLRCHRLPRPPLKTSPPSPFIPRWAQAQDHRPSRQCGQGPCPRGRRTTAKSTASRRGGTSLSSGTCVGTGSFAYCGYVIGT